MRPMLMPQLVNPAFGDPGLYVDFRNEKRALLFDIGDIGSLAPRKLLRLSHVFVSHTHMDHFMGFDALLRVSLGRDVAVRLFGPPGFVDQVAHKLAERMYKEEQAKQQAQQPGGEKAAEAAKQEDGNVVDAEYTEVKDKK